MKNIIITGGHGFLGSSIARALLKRPNYNVYSVDILKKFIAPTSVPIHRRFMNFKRDISTEFDYREIIKGDVEILFHCVGNSQWEHSKKTLNKSGRAWEFEFYEEVITEELKLIKHAIRIAKNVNAKKIVLFLSSENGDFNRMKSVIDEVISLYDFKLNKYIIQVPFLYGIFQSPLEIIPYMIMSNNKKKDTKIISDLDKKIQLVYVDDATDTIVDKILSSNRKEEFIKFVSQSYNLKSISKILREMNLSELMQIESERNIESNLESEEFLIENISVIKIESNLAYRIAQTIEFYRNNFKYYDEWLSNN